MFSGFDSFWIRTILYPYALNESTSMLCIMQFIHNLYFTILLNTLFTLLCLAEVNRRSIYIMPGSWFQLQMQRLQGHHLIFRINNISYRSDIFCDSNRPYKALVWSDLLYWTIWIHRPIQFTCLNHVNKMCTRGDRLADEALCVANIVQVDYFLKSPGSWCITSQNLIHMLFIHAVYTGLRYKSQEQGRRAYSMALMALPIRWLK